MQLQKLFVSAPGQIERETEGGQVALEKQSREGVERVKRERAVPSAVLVQVEVVLVGKQRSGEAVAAALHLLRSTPLLWFL